METLTDIFSYICGQDRCFVIDQTTLPVCQRCMGLYMGACLTGIWLLLSRGWRRGLPCLEVFLVNVGMLLTAMLGGLHIIDPGPRWRLMCGLWTGHVIVLWLIGAAWHLYILLNHGVQKRLTWTTNDKAQAFVCAALLTVVALIFDKLICLGWYPWTMVIVIGASTIFCTTFLAVTILIIQGIFGRRDVL